MTTEPAAELSYAEYLALEEKSETKHEYVNGLVYAMAGGSITHARLSMTFGRLAGNALSGRCGVFSSDLRVRIEATGRATYPDVTIVCGKAHAADDDPHAITNPSVIVEVLSDSTEASDRGDKWAHYQRLESLREYVLVSQDEPFVEVFHRDGDRWIYRAYREGELELPSLDVRLSIDELYADPTA